MIPPAATVVVPSCERDGWLASLLGELLAHEARAAFEVIVVDQSAGGSQRARAVVAGDERVRFLSQATPNLSLARNAGIAASRAPIVVFADDDVRLSPGWLDAHVAAYEDASVHAVAGRVTDVRWPGTRRGPTGDFSWFGYDPGNYDATERRRVRTGLGSNMSFRRASLEAVGGFDERLGGGVCLREDSDCFLRVHARFGGVLFEPAAHVVHLAAPTGGVRTAALAERPELYRNEALFFLKHFRAGAFPVFLALTFLRHAVLPQARSGALSPATVLRATRAMAAGTALGVRLARRN